MTLDDIAEAAGVLNVAITALQAAVPSTAGRPGAEFRYACGDLLADAAALIPAATVFTDVETCFALAVAAAASLNGFVALRSAMVTAAASSTGQPALWIAGICYCMALGAEVTILAATTFTSSNDAQTALKVIGRAFALAQEWTADNQMPALYQALIASGAAVARDLMARAARLPSRTTYTLPVGTTSHALAYRLYGDATRCDALRAENGVIHPAFMPASGTALSE